MGRSQRHKVYIQGYAADDAIRAEGMVAGTQGANNPPQGLYPFPPGTRSPTISGLSPNTSAVNTGTKTVTVTGTNFVSGLSKISIGSVLMTTTFVSATSLTCSVDTTKFVAGPQKFKVNNGPYASNESTFTFT